MKRKLGKKLVLSRETVRELTDTQLQWVAGGKGGNPPPPRTSWLAPGTQGGCTMNLPSASAVSCVCPTCGPSCNLGCCG
jgi:hypothetical protein